MAQQTLMETETQQMRMKVQDMDPKIFSSPSLTLLVPSNGQKD